MTYYPEAYIVTQNITKNRLKVYTNNRLYLNEGDEFQIEFENYTTRNFLAKIKLNGEWISNSGLILKPGQHIYLDRYLDTPRRFKFSTYAVDNTPQAKQAIKNNGEVEIYFYEQLINFNFTNYPSITQPDYWWYNNQDITGSVSYRGSNANALYGAGRYGYADRGYDIMSVNCCNTNQDDQINLMNERNEGKIETGRVEQGSHSSQVLKEENMEFNNWHSHFIIYKILPISQQTYEQPVRNYCSSCSYRVRDSKWVFCPKCGNKIF